MSKLWKLAKNNSKLPVDIYKVMMKNKLLFGGSKQTITRFKQLYHSNKTKPEFRMMLLTSIFPDSPNWRKSLTQTLGMDRGINVYLTPSYDNQYFVLQRGDLGVVRLPKVVLENIREWKPIAVERYLLSKALETNNIQYQKFALMVEPINKCLYSFGHIVKQFAFLNDPYSLYNRSPIKKNDIEDEERTPSVGHYKASAEIFNKHLEHLKNEFLKYEQFLNTLGIDTMEVNVTYGVTKNTLEHFINTDYTGKPSLEIGDLYAIHDDAKELVRSIGELAVKINSIQSTDKTIYKLNPRTVIPNFVPYSTKQSSDFYPDEDIVETLEDILNKLLV